ncbi:MAG: hypothetical protein NDJ89_17480 [Oligoflexia bacterium]|nr:hypothetical protein [Oligoflexia bacterium]
MKRIISSLTVTSLLVLCCLSVLGLQYLRLACSQQMTHQEIAKAAQAQQEPQSKPSCHGQPAEKSSNESPFRPCCSSADLAEVPSSASISAAIDYANTLATLPALLPGEILAAVFSLPQDLSVLSPLPPPLSHIPTTVLRI